MNGIQRAAGVACIALTAACASAGTDTDPNPIDPNAPLACINIDNRQGAGTMERLYLVDSARRTKEGISGNFSPGVRTGDGVRIGDAPVGRVTRFCSQALVLPGTYFIRVEIATADNFDPADVQDNVGGWETARRPRIMETREIVIEPGDVWTWEVRRDRWSCAPNSATGGDC